MLLPAEIILNNKYFSKKQEHRTIIYLFINCILDI